MFVIGSLCTARMVIILATKREVEAAHPSLDPSTPDLPMAEVVIVQRAGRPCGLTSYARFIFIP